MTTSRVAGLIIEVLMRIQVLEGDLMTVRTVIGRHGHRHLPRHLLIVLAVTSDAVECIDFLGKDRVFWVLELPHRMGVREFVEGFPVASDTRSIGHPSRRENVLFRLIRMTGRALHFDLMVGVGSPAWQNCGFVLGDKKQIVAVSSNGRGDQEPGQKGGATKSNHFSKKHLF